MVGWRFSGMPRAKGRLWAEIIRTIKLASPIAVAFLGEMGMVVTDYVMAGRLGSAELAAAGLSSQILFMPIFWSMGALGGVGAVGAQAHGAKDSCQVSLAIRQGLRMATILVIPCVGFSALAWPVLPRIENDPRVVAMSFDILIWGFARIPLSLWFAVLRNFVTIVERPTIITLASFAGLFVTIVANYIFMFGALGMPKLGVAAIGLSATLTSLVQLATISIYLLMHPELRTYRLFKELRHYHAKMFTDILRVGGPIAIAYVFESGLFFLTTLLMGFFTTDALAGHNVVMSITSVSFMIPYALSQAATVRVGFCMGENNPFAARRAGMVAMSLAIGWMLLAASAMRLCPEFLAGFYLDMKSSANAGAISYVFSMMMIGALFQIADGVQVTAAGALRGFKDTKVPMMISALGYWVFGLVGAVLLAFPLGFGPLGLWMGLALGLGVSAILLSWRWFRVSHHFTLQSQ